MQLIERDQKTIIIENSAFKKEQYEILDNFPFSSESKRMGIVLKDLSNGRIIFYLKGAEVVMRTKMKPYYKAIIDEACENLAMYL